MPMLFRDRMNIVHIWKRVESYDKCERAGLHYNMSTCNGKESDVLIQMNADQWVKRNLTPRQQHDLGWGDFLKVKQVKDYDDY